MTDFFPIETPYNSEDYKLMKAVVNKGIDSRLEGFTKSEFKKSPNFNNKFLWNIAVSELPILYRRLEELYEETGNEDYLSFKEDVQNVADVSLNAIAGGEYGEELDEMIDPYDPMDYNQTIDGFPTATSDLNADGIDTAAPGSSAPSSVADSAFKNQAIEDYIDDDTIGQEMMAEIEISEAELKEIIKGRINEIEKNDFVADHSLEHEIVKITNDQDENGKFGETGTIVSVIEPSKRQAATGYKLVNYIIEFRDTKVLAYLRSEFEPVQKESLGTLGMSYDKQGSEFPDMAENSSDSLANQHGMNAKPQTMIDEVTDTERYERVVFMQGEEANEVMDILNNDGEDAAMDYLRQWHYPGEGEGSNEIGAGTEDEIYEKDGYTMNWNPYLPYVGLVYDTEFGLNEDSITRRKLAGQRGKTVPLGQHAPHSQAAKK
jgi:hypothetical protein